MHVWRGYHGLGAHSGIHFFLDVDLMGSGFGITKLLVIVPMPAA